MALSLYHRAQPHYGLLVMPYTYLHRIKSERGEECKSEIKEEKVGVALLGRVSVVDAQPFRRLARNGSLHQSDLDTLRSCCSSPEAS